MARRLTALLVVVMLTMLALALSTTVTFTSGPVPTAVDPAAKTVVE